MDMQEMFEKIEDKINKKIDFAEDFRYRYGLQEAMVTVKDVINEYQYKSSTANDTEKRVRKTRKDDFFTKHPNARKSSSGEPVICAENVGYTFGCIKSTSGFPMCHKCWGMPLDERE